MFYDRSLDQIGRQRNKKLMTNNFGMKLVEIPAGEFLMGQVDGRECDERFVHQVQITTPFHMAECPVTNAQYEAFDPDHKRLRGIRGVSNGDDEAVNYVSWHDAVAFCKWLSEKEGQTYRLPTEAEWEYACRAGTTTDYWTGEELSEAFYRNQPVEGDWDLPGRGMDDDLREKKGVVSVDLTVGQTPANAWGVKDVHGIVEEWCGDWYGPYPKSEEVDPVGPSDGLARVTRGGSHNTYAAFLRSAERHAALPEDKHWLIGFRVVCGELPDGDVRDSVALAMDDARVKNDIFDWPEAREEAFFEEPIVFVKPDESDWHTSWLNHHHHPSITWCENGDLLAVWYNTRSEIGREMRVLSSRLRCGETEWEKARLFFDVADRNTTGSTVFHDGKGALYYFGGVSESSHHRDQCMVMAKSGDNGKTWTRPKIITSVDDRHKYTPLDSAFIAADGSLVLAMDYAPLGFKANECGAGVFVSADGGETWRDRISGKQMPEIVAGGNGGLIAGFHTAVVQRTDGSLLAFGRTNVGTGLTPLDGQMPQSVSYDMGQSWTYSASPFPVVGGGQRLAMIRLAEGPILFVSFTDNRPVGGTGMTFWNGKGDSFPGYGMFAAVSYDEGETWPVRRLLTTGGLAREMDGGGNTHKFVMDETHAETRGYLGMTQTPDNVIHLISSRYHYRFNLAWLELVSGVS